MFGWLKKSLKSRQPGDPWRVNLADERIEAIDPAGEARSIMLTDIRRIAIQTTADGPFGDDVWWLLFAKDDQPAIRFPQGAVGEQAALDLFTARPGFDFEEMIQAMGSTDNALFLVWRAED